MNYTKLYKKYFDQLIDCRNKKIPSIMYPPNYQGDKINFNSIYGSSSSNTL